MIIYIYNIIIIIFIYTYIYIYTTYLRIIQESLHHTPSDCPLFVLLCSARCLVQDTWGFLSHKWQVSWVILRVFESCKSWKRQFFPVAASVGIMQLQIHFLASTTWAAECAAKRATQKHSSNGANHSNQSHSESVFSTSFQHFFNIFSTRFRKIS